MFKQLAVFKDILPSFLQQKLGYEMIGEPEIPEFITADKDQVSQGGIHNFLYNFDIEFENIAQLIYQYNQFSMLDFVEEAIDEIVDETIVLDEFNPIVSLNLDMIDISNATKKKIIEEFETIKRLLKFDIKADEYFRRWYIQGRYYLQPLFSKNKKDGIIGFHHVSPYKIFRFFDKKQGKYFYYINNNDEENFLKKRYFDPEDVPKEYIVSSDHIVFIPSGLTDAKGKYYISHLHKAIKPANQLKLLEDSLVVYRFTRAPERRAFYIDVGRLGQTKADQYVKSLMNKFKSRMTYDTSTGQLNQSKSIMTMLEDYWLPRMGTKGTEVQTISGGQQLGEITDVLYFKRRTWKALKIPSSRADNDNAPSIDFGSNEFSRDELKFARFCRKLRIKFADMLTQCLKIQLISKNIVNIKEWVEMFEDSIRYEWNENSYWAESKELALLERRVEMLDKVENYKDKYFSKSYINKQILRRTDDEIEIVNNEIEEDLKEAAEKAKLNPENNEESNTDNFNENGEIM